MRKATSFNFALYTQVLFWLALFTLLLFSFLNSGSIVLAAMAAAAILVVCHMINFYIIFSWLTPVYFEKRKYVAFFLGVVLVILLLTPIRMWIESRFIHRPFLMLRGRHLRGLVIFSELTAAGFAFLFRMAIDSHIHKRRADDVEKLQLETELKFLKSQMNPHFLFNTINNVYSLSLAGSENTPEALLKLSGLLRYLLYDCNHKVPFSSELIALESYIALFQLRYEEPLNISLRSEVVRREMPVEPMLLIPLLENAIKHSGVGVMKGAFIAMEFREEEGRLLAEIRNSRFGDDFKKMPEAGGIGLPNIRKRLEMSGSSGDELLIRQNKDVFEVWIRIPGY